MLPFSSRSTAGVAATLGLLALVPMVGCSGLGGDHLSSIPPLSDEPPPGQAEAVAESDVAEPDAGETADAGTSGDRAVLAHHLVVTRGAGGRSEAHSVWIHAIEPVDEDAPKPPYRWRYPDLEDLLARPAEHQPDWQGYLADEDDVVAAHAAIALARNGKPDGVTQLAAAARSPSLKVPMRCAAVEALAAVESPEVVALLRGLIDQYGRRGADSSQSVAIAELHAELIRGLARHVSAADDPRFVEALSSRSPEVLVETLLAWAQGQGDGLPIEAIDLRTHGDCRVRAAALKALAGQRHPQAHEHLTAALKDHDYRVRTAAIEALGDLGGPQSEATLTGLLKSREPQVRLCTVTALAGMRAFKAALQGADDSSWRVRRGVARILAECPDRDGVAVAGRLLDDRSAEVQRDVVKAVAKWPLPAAGPILLAAMQKQTFVTRETAARQLAKRWEPATQFPTQGPPERRAEVLEQLQDEFAKQFGSPGEESIAQAAEPTTTSGVSPELVALVEQQIAEEDLPALLQHGPVLVEALEQLVFDRQQLLPEPVYQEVLPKLDPVFLMLQRLASHESAQRRQAASELVELTAARPLGRLATYRLIGLVMAEPDQLVWQSVLRAVADDPSDAAAELAYVAIGHPAPEVRRRACLHLAAHPDARHTLALLPTLHDEHHSVVCAAVDALGRCGGPDEAQALKELLGSNNEELRLETAIALARLADPEGAAALLRLACSGDPNVRRRVALAMGEIPDPSFVPTLIQLLDDRVSVCRGALESLPKVVGQDMSTTEDGIPLATTQRVGRWKEWFHR